jgi:hypothetical protein
MPRGGTIYQWIGNPRVSITNVTTSRPFNHSQYTLRAKGKILKQQSTGRHAQGFFPPAAAALLLLAASSLSGFESNASLAQDASTPLPIAAPVAKPTAGPVIKTTTTTTTTTITTTKNTDSDDLSIAPTPLILSTANLGGSVDSLQPVIVFDKKFRHSRTRAKEKYLRLG